MNIADVTLEIIQKREEANYNIKRKDLISLLKNELYNFISKNKITKIPDKDFVFSIPREKVYGMSNCEIKSLLSYSGFDLVIDSKNMTINISQLTSTIAKEILNNLISKFSKYVDNETQKGVEDTKIVLSKLQKGNFKYSINVGYYLLIVSFTSSANSQIYLDVVEDLLKAEGFRKVTIAKDKWEIYLDKNNSLVPEEKPSS